MVGSMGKYIPHLFLEKEKKSIWPLRNFSRLCGSIQMLCYERHAQDCKAAAT